MTSEREREIKDRIHLLNLSAAVLRAGKKCFRYGGFMWQFTLRGWKERERSKRKRCICFDYSMYTQDTAILDQTSEGKRVLVTF